jgi:selenocysteine lyase/cysteine desulfurase
VFFVTASSHRYLKEVEMREEGGTPSIVGAVRAGLAMQLKEAVGSDTIMSLEEGLCRHAFCQWESVEELVIVGPHHIPRLPIFSFLIRHTKSGLFLHHNYVSTLLNDLFGIQARGGCSCAGPYAQVQREPWN